MVYVRQSVDWKSVHKKGGTGGGKTGVSSAVAELCVIALQLFPYLGEIPIDG